MVLAGDLVPAGTTLVTPALETSDRYQKVEPWNGMCRGTAITNATRMQTKQSGTWAIKRSDSAVHNYHQTWGYYNTNVIDYDYLPPARLRINKITTITLEVITITFVLNIFRTKTNPICMVWC